MVECEGDGWHCGQKVMVTVSWYFSLKEMMCLGGQTGVGDECIRGFWLDGTFGGK